MYRPIRVWKDRLLGDWTTGCARCHQNISYSSDWEGAMVMALGHMSMYHPQWPAVTAQALMGEDFCAHHARLRGSVLTMTVGSE